MTLLVHVAGNADLGFTQKADAVTDAARARCGELTAGDDPEAAHRLILDLAYTTPVPDGWWAMALRVRRCARQWNRRPISSRNLGCR